MPPIPDKDTFQPSPETLNKWLSTRKAMLNVGGVQMPAFFSDAGNSSDTNWFYVALIGELVGLVTTIYGGMRSGGVFLLLSGLAIVMFIFCDYFFAVLLHRKKDIECKLNTQRLLLKSGKEDEEKKAKVIKERELEMELEKGRFVDFLLQTGIILIAVIKTFAIVLLGVFNNLILYVPFAVIYFIVAYVHLRHTGYYFAYVGTEAAIASEHRRLGSHTAKRGNEKVTLDSPLDEAEGLPKYHPHLIVKDEATKEKTSDDAKYYYRVKTLGVLTDDDIINLIAQSDSQKIELFKACRNIQFEQNLGQGPSSSRKSLLARIFFRS